MLLSLLWQLDWIKVTEQYCTRMFINTELGPNLYLGTNLVSRPMVSAGLCSSLSHRTLKNYWLERGTKVECVCHFTTKTEVYGTVVVDMCAIFVSTLSCMPTGWWGYKIVIAAGFQNQTHRVEPGLPTSLKSTGKTISSWKNQDLGESLTQYDMTLLGSGQ